jgi:hypothetical protein
VNAQLAMFQQVVGLGGAVEREMVERNVVIVAREPQETSLKAALRALPKSGTKRARLYDYLASCGGATDEEMEHALGISGNTVRPTRVSLVRDGLVEDSGLVRPTVSGNDAIVWRVHRGV